MRQSHETRKKETDFTNAKSMRIHDNFVIKQGWKNWKVQFDVCFLIFSPLPLHRKYECVKSDCFFRKNAQNCFFLILYGRIICSSNFNYEFREFSIYVDTRHHTLNGALFSWLLDFPCITFGSTATCSDSNSHILSALFFAISVLGHLKLGEFSTQ